MASPEVDKLEEILVILAEIERSIQLIHGHIEDAASVREAAIRGSLGDVHPL